VIAVDTNILVYAHRKESPWHFKSKLALQTLFESHHHWAIAWSSVHEFLGVVTNSKFLKQPTPLALAFEQIEVWLGSGNLTLLSEGFDHLERLESLATHGGVSGGMIHDARIAAICLQHGVSELWTADRDFSRFPKLKTKNPLLG
jgi:uncharacterized protein